MPDEATVESNNTEEATASAQVEVTTEKATVSEQQPEDIRGKFEVDGDDSIENLDTPTREADRPVLEISSSGSSEEEAVAKIEMAEEAEAAAAPTKPPVTKHKTADERFNDLTAKRYEAEARAKLADERYETLAAELEKLKSPQQPQAAQPPAALTMPKMPTKESVDFDDTAYALAMDKYQTDLETYQDARFDQRMTARDAKFAQARQVTDAQQVADTVRKTYHSRVADFSKGHPDYANRVHSAEFKAPQGVLDFIESSEDGPAIAYAIATDSKLAEKLLSMPTEAAALVEIGKLQVTTKLAKHTKSVSGAPEPISPIDISANPGSGNDIDRMAMGDFMAKRMNEYWPTG